MIINKTGEKYEFDGTEYFIGEEIIGTKESKYEGLFGVVTEIRDDKDKDTDNHTPDMYCTFNAPILPSEILNVEKRFSELYGKPMTLADINFDDVIMAPKMIAPISELNKSKRKITVYEVSENWVYNDDGGVSTELYAGFDDAMLAFKLAISNDLSKGIGKIHKADSQKKDFISQIEEWEEID